MRAKLIVGIGLVCLLALVGPANASIQITLTESEDETTAIAVNVVFAGGESGAVTVSPYGTQSIAENVVVSITNINTSIGVFDYGANMWDDPARTVLSDNVEVYGNGNNLTLWFHSAPATNSIAPLVPGQGFAGLSAFPGSAFDVLEQYPTAFAFDDTVLTIYSDTTVPEPSTLIIWSLLGALAITAGWRRRKAA